MVTRKDDDDWIVLLAEDRVYDVKAGDLLKWSDTFCSRMVEGRGPHIAPRSADIPAYVQAPVGQQVHIEAYVGVPIVQADGTLFGTLCAIDPAPKPPDIVREEPLVQLLASLLGSILASDLQADQQRRRAERAETEAMVDELSQVGSRRAWERIVEAEETRCSRYGHPASVIVIDLDKLKEVNDDRGHAAGDEMLRSAARAICAGVREADFVARTGGDEFAVLAVNAHLFEAEKVSDRIKAALAAENIEASIGLAARVPSSGLAGAWHAADLRMYHAKKQRHSQPSSQPGAA
jgi:diguanylate cyclase (GGDEF)-like protein